MKSAQGQHDQPCGPGDVVEGGQFSGLQDHLEMGHAARLPHRAHLLVDLRVPAGQECPAVDDHVYLVRARVHRVGDVGELHRERGAPRREGGRHRGDLDRRLPVAARHGDQVGVHAHGGDRGDVGVGRNPATRALAHRPLTLPHARALQRGQVDHPDGHVEGPELGLTLDGPGGQRGRPLLRTDLVHAGQPVQHQAQRRIRRKRLAGAGHQGARSRRPARFRTAAAGQRRGRDFAARPVPAARSSLAGTPRYLARRESAPPSRWPPARWRTPA